MRIQILGLNYAPEKTGIAPYTTGLATHLARSHDVTVITGVPHYPDWEVPSGYKRWRRIESVGDVRVVRLRHFVPKSPGLVGRLAFETSWALRAVAYGARVPTDLVIAVVPALLAPQVGRMLARRHRVPLGVLVQDIMGSAAAQGGVRGGSHVARLISAVERSGLHAADRVATIHPRLSVELANVARRPERPSVIFNWTHVSQEPGRSRTLRRRYGWRAGEVIALHSGNMGLKQNLEVVIDAARLAERQDRHVRFVLAGNGSQRDKLKQYAADCPQVQFVDTVSEEEYMDLLTSADVLLVNERPGMREMSLPSKLTSYLVSGKPIVVATDPGSSTAEFVTASGGGLVTPAGDAGKLLDAVSKVGCDESLAVQLAADGQTFAATNLSIDGAMAAYDRWIDDLSNLRMR